MYSEFKLFHVKPKYPVYPTRRVGYGEAKMYPDLTYTPTGWLFLKDPWL